MPSGSQDSLFPSGRYAEARPLTEVPPQQGDDPPPEGYYVCASFKQALAAPVPGLLVLHLGAWRQVEARREAEGVPRTEGLAIYIEGDQRLVVEDATRLAAKEEH